MLRERRMPSNQQSTLLPTATDRKTQMREDTPEEITIKFVGDIQQNIAEVARAVRCSESAREEVKSILRIYASKISKLREERDFYRQLLCLSEERENQEVTRLREQVAILQEQLESRPKDNCQRCTCFQDSDFRTSKFTEHQDSSLSRATLRSFQQCSNEDQMLMSSVAQDSLQVSQTNKESQTKSGQGQQNSNLTLNQGQSIIQNECLNASVSEQELNRLMLKYNINTEELQQILEQYDRENRQAYEMFDSEQQRQLYRLGQRMHKDLWNKKVIKDIQKISLQHQ